MVLLPTLKQQKDTYPDQSHFKIGTIRSMILGGVKKFWSFSKPYNLTGSLFN